MRNRLLLGAINAARLPEAFDASAHLRELVDKLVAALRAVAPDHPLLEQFRVAK